LKPLTDLISGVKHFQRNVILCTKTSTISKNTKVNIILPPILYGCETWSLTLLKEHRLRECGNKVLKKIYGPRGTMHQGSGEDNIERSFTIQTLQ
jgi:hypothetical protein